MGNMCLGSHISFVLREAMDVPSLNHKIVNKISYDKVNL
jgi:hypothetical protein